MKSCDGDDAIGSVANDSLRMRSHFSFVFCVAAIGISKNNLNRKEIFASEVQLDDLSRRSSEAVGFSIVCAGHPTFEVVTASGWKNIGASSLVLARNDGSEREI